MRTPESFQVHLDRTVAQCHSSWIALSRNTLLGEEFLLTPHLCKSNYCEVCRKKNLLTIRKQLFHAMRGRKWRLVTLTFPDHSKDLLGQLCKLYSTFKKFIQRVRRVYSDVSFVRTIEIHQSGYPHIHMVVDTYIPISFLKIHWHAVGGGIVDITSGNRKDKKRVPAGYKQAARYLTEEIEKRVQDPHRLGSIFWQAHCKAITTSRNLKLPVGSSDWTFRGIHRELNDAMYHFEWLKTKAQWEGTDTPGVQFQKDCIKFGRGIKSDLERPHTHAPA